MSDYPPLVLLHGFAQSAESWQTTIEFLPRTLQVHAIDLPGHGSTGLGRGAPSVELARDMVAEAVDRLGGSAAIWGYSQGARVAFDFALERPDATVALIVESGTPGIRDEVKRANRRSADYALATRIEAGTIEQFVDMWEKLPALGEQSKTQIESQREVRLKQDPKALAAALIGIGQAAFEPTWDRMSELTCPTLLLSGARDAIYTAHCRELAGLIPDSWHQIVADASHAVHMAQPEVTAELVTQFLETI